MRRPERATARWLVAVAGVHLVAGRLGVDRAATADPRTAGSPLDALGLVVLTVVSVLFFVVATYTVGYLRRRARSGTGVRELPAGVSRRRLAGRA